MSDGNKIIDGLKEVAAASGMGVLGAEYDGSQLVMHVTKDGQLVKDLPPGVEVEHAGAAGNVVGSVTPRMEVAGTPSLLRTSSLTRSDLDLPTKSVLKASPHELYQRSINYWKCKDVYRTVINSLTNFASKGFENDIDDPNIKNFYDNWVIDSKFDQHVEQVFFDFFRVGFVRSYRVMGPYIPKINNLSSLPGTRPKKVAAAKKNNFSKGFIPIAYTILNPMFVDIKGSLMFGKTAIFLKPEAGDEIRALMELDKRKLSKFHRDMLKALPSDFKRAVKKKEPIPLNQDNIGEIDYRRQPYERYPLPRGVGAFESIDFKDNLKIADYSTLDGITNYILKITIGNDKFPVRKQEALEAAGQMFDTVSKAFKVVWDHTLKVEKISSDNVGDILGKDKYIQTNEDMTAALNFPRALIDGETEASPAALAMATKAVIEEINYARRQVKRWIYEEYKSVAHAMNFERFPSVRFDDIALKDDIALMSIVQGMIDRRIMSYDTGQKKLGLDPATEISKMREEVPLVLEGVLGIIGSPFQQSTTQPSQNTPKKTPSEGRPRARPAKKPKDKDTTKPPKTNPKKQVIDNTKASLSIDDVSLETIEDYIEALIRLKRKKTPQ